jgi:hypothetical protein
MLWQEGHFCASIAHMEYYPHHIPDWKRYALALLITVLVFIAAIWVSNIFQERRLGEIKSIEDNISIDILSIETQFDLLAEVSCDDIDNSVLSREINSLASRLGHMEARRGSDDEEVIRLKEYYSLLQIKDYLLMKKIGRACGNEPVSILYFYSNEGDCADCEKEGYVLTYLREHYPGVRVYAFDYHIDISAVETLTTLYDISAGELPSIILNNNVFSGFQSKETIENLLPESLRVTDEKEVATTTETVSRENKE